MCVSRSNDANTIDLVSFPDPPRMPGGSGNETKSHQSVSRMAGFDGVYRMYLQHDTGCKLKFSIIIIPPVFILCL